MKLRDLLNEGEKKSLNSTGAQMDINIFPQFMENGKYETNSSQGILIINNIQDNPNIIAKDALNKWKEINTFLKQFSDGNKWRLRGISMGYKNLKAKKICQELLKLYPSGEIKIWNENNIYFIFPLLDISKAQQNEIKIKSPIGQGGEHTIFPSKAKPGFVIKKLTGKLMKEDWIEIIKTAQQHPGVFAKIDKVNFDKGYFIQEELDEKSLTKDGNELYNYLKSNNILYRNNQDKLNYVGLDILTILYLDPDRIDMLNDTPWENTLKPKLERFFEKLNETGHGIEDNYLGDLRLTNVGYDKDGEIKILDFNFDEL